MACFGSAPTFVDNGTFSFDNCQVNTSIKVNAACGSSGYTIKVVRSGSGLDATVYSATIPDGPLTALEFTYSETPPCVRGQICYNWQIFCDAVLQETNEANCPTQGGAASITFSDVSNDAQCVVTTRAQVSKPCGECEGTIKCYKKAGAPVTFDASEVIYTDTVPAGQLIGQQFQTTDTPGDGTFHYGWRVFASTGGVDDSEHSGSIVNACNIYNPFTTPLPEGEMEKQVVLVQVQKVGGVYQYTDIEVLNLEEQRMEWWQHKNGGCGSFRFLTHASFPEVFDDALTDSWEIHVRIKLGTEKIHTTWYRGIIRSIKTEEQGQETLTEFRGYGYVELLDNVQVQKRYSAGLTVSDIVDDIIDSFVKPNTRIRRPRDVDVTSGDSGVDSSPYKTGSELHFECSALKALKFLAELQGSREFGVDEHGFIYFRTVSTAIGKNFFLRDDILSRVAGGKTFIEGNDVKVAGKAFGAVNFLQNRPDVTDITLNGLYESTVEVPWITGDQDASRWADNIIAKHKISQTWSVFTWKNVTENLTLSHPLDRIKIYGDDISNDVHTYDIAKIQFIEGGWITRQEIREIGSPTIQPELDQQLLRAVIYAGYYPRDLIEELEVRIKDQIESLKGRDKQYRYPNDVTVLPASGRIPGELLHYSKDVTNNDVVNSPTELQDPTFKRGVPLTYLDKQWTKLSTRRTFNSLPARGKYIGEIVSLITDVTNQGFGELRVWSGTAWGTIGSGGGGGGSGTVTGTGANGQVAYWTTSTNISGHSEYIFDSTNVALAIGNTSVLAASSGTKFQISRSGLVQMILTDSSQGSGSKNWLIRNNSTDLAFLQADDAGSSTFTQVYMSRSTGHTGFGTDAPRRRVDILDATGNPQLRLTYTDNSVYTDIRTDSAGDTFVTNTGDEFQYRADKTTGNYLEVVNTNNASASAHARFYAEVGGASAGDPVTVYAILGSGDAWIHGMDNSDSRKYKISYGTALGTNDRFIITPTGKVGINTATIPHGSVGWAMLALDGTDASADGPHIQLTTSVDDYPLMQILPYAHGNVSIFFDSYFDGAGTKASSTTAFAIRKISDQLQFHGDGSLTPGGLVPGSARMVITEIGRVGIGNTNPQTQLVVSGGANGFEFVPGATGGISILQVYDRVAASYGGLRFDTASLSYAENGATDRMTFGATGVVFNDPGANYNFRIEGDNAPFLFNLSASDDRIGIASGSPRRRFDILHASEPQLRLTQTDNSIYVDLQINSSGQFVIVPTGKQTLFTSLVNDTTDVIIYSSGISSTTYGARDLRLVFQEGSYSGAGRGSDIVWAINPAVNTGRYAFIGSYAAATGGTNEVAGHIIFGTKALVTDTSLSIRMWIENDGVVTVGATDPAVRHTFNVNDASTAGSLISWTRTAISKQWGLICSSDATFLTNVTDTILNVQFANAGNVGINVNSSQTVGRKLEVVDGSGNPQCRLSYTNASVYTDFTTNSSGECKVSPSGAGHIFGMEESLAGTGPIFRVRNSDNTAGSYVQMRLEVGGSSAGDPLFHLAIGPNASVVGFCIAIDNDDNDTFKISYASGTFATPGSNDWFKIATGGDTTIAKNLAIGNATDFAGGIGVLAIKQDTEPTSDPAAGTAVIYVKDDRLKCRIGGNVYTLTPN